MTPRKRRADDHIPWNWIMIGGFIFAGASFFLRYTDHLTGNEFAYALGFSMLLIRPDKLVAIAKARFSNGGNSSDQGTSGSDQA